MKYHLVCEQKLAEGIGDLLEEEISRFDIRADVRRYSFVGLRKRDLVASKADLVIIIGTNRSKHVVRLAEFSNMRVCFIYQFLLTYEVPLKRIEDSWLFYSDQPSSMHSLEGSPLFDFVKSQKTAGFNEANHAGHRIVVAFSDDKSGKDAKSLTYRLNNGLEAEVEWLSISHSFPVAINKISEASVVLTFDQMASAFAVATNTPSINLQTKSLFFKAKNPRSISEVVLNNTTIKTISVGAFDEIAQEIQNVLNDFNHCAEILDQYQVIKSKVGTNNFVRTAAQTIVDQLEEELN
ncbi:MAG: hypothetical protein HRT61_01840 [Ekhidna sp.]|nr:hypothetical protein [Ekhidna sp.]